MEAIQLTAIIDERTEALDELRQLEFVILGADDFQSVGGAERANLPTKLQRQQLAQSKNESGAIGVAILVGGKASTSIMSSSW